MKNRIVLLVTIVLAVLLCSCNNRTEINCGHEESSNYTAENSDCSSQAENVSAENSVEYFEQPIDTITDRDRFIAKYGYDIDIFDYMPDDELYTLLLNNPIDQWASEVGPSAGTTGEMLEIENILHQNWSREIDVSLGNLEGILSADIYNALCENVQHKIELASETRMLSQNILRDLKLDGTYSTVLTKVQLNEAYEKIVFELKYLEYVAYTYYDISDKQVSIQFIES